MFKFESVMSERNALLFGEPHFKLDYFLIVIFYGVGFASGVTYRLECRPQLLYCTWCIVGVQNQHCLVPSKYFQDYKVGHTSCIMDPANLRL